MISLLDSEQRDNLTRKSAEVLAQAIDDFPNMLLECTAEAAARIVADLIKIHITSPEPETDPSAALAEVIERCCKMEDEPEQTDGGDSY